MTPYGAQPMGLQINNNKDHPTSEKPTKTSQSQIGSWRSNSCFSWKGCVSIIVLFVNVNSEMTTTPTSIPEDCLGESWVEVGRSPDRTTPLPFPAAEEYLRLLKEAQRESNQSSARHSLASSVKGSPKSPPNSPNTELSVEEELKGVYINYSGKVERLLESRMEESIEFQRGEDWIRKALSKALVRWDPVYMSDSRKDAEWIDKNTDWIWDWSSRPDQEPPKDWKFRHPVSRKMLSIRTAKVGKVALFSREMMYTIVVTNVLSLILGAGFGVWLSRRGIMLSPINLD